MATATSPSVPLAISHLLDKMASTPAEDSSLYDPVNISSLLPGISSHESLALENSLRKLVSKMRRLEEPPSYRPPLVSGKPLTQDLYDVHVCSNCGNRLRNVPLTPDDTPTTGDPPQVKISKIRLSTLASRIWNDKLMFVVLDNGYESGTESDFTTVSYPSTPDTVVSLSFRH